MTVSEVLEKVDILRRNNPFTIKDKMRWLNQCEARIQRECLLMPRVIATYDAKIDAEENLIAVEPYDELYVYYICAKIDESLGEMARYNDTILQYNDVQGNYQKYLIKKYDPAHNKISLCRDAPVIFQGDRIEITLYGLPAEAENITEAKVIFTQGENVKEKNEVTAEADTLSVVLTEAESYALSKGNLYVGYEIEANGYRYKDVEAKQFYVKLAPELQIIAKGESGSPVDASLTIAGRAADAAETGAQINQIKNDLKEKAPAGHGGYGEKLEGASLSDENDLENFLNSVIADMGNDRAYRFRFTINAIAGVLIGDWTWVATVFKTSENYAFVVAKSGFGGRVTKIEKVYSNGTWLPVEWENPPMEPGVEYRTTGRSCWGPIYTKLINYGGMPDSNRWAVSHGAAVAYIMQCIGTITAGEHIGSSIPNDTISVFADKENITIVTTKDHSGDKAYVQIWYTKE